MKADLLDRPLMLDPSKPIRFADGSAHAMFEVLRRDSPIHYCPQSPFGPFWSITLYEHIVEIEALPSIFSSEAKHGGVSVIDVVAGEAAYLESLIMMDPPNHSRKRQTIAPAFAPSEMMRLKASIRERTAACLDGLPRGESIDWVQAVSINLTIDMLATLFDFPWDERHKLQIWSDAITSLDMIKNRPDERLVKMFEMASRFQELWQQRSNSAPAPDLLSMMVHSTEFGEMDAAEFVGNMATLVVAGNDTTRNSMSGMVEAFNLWPDQWDRLCAEPELIANAASEIIRWQCPALHMRRTALEDLDFHGHQIRKGDKVVLWYISANRQESVFPDSERLCIDRPNARRHLSFGHGIHRCVGARLAELQLQILLEEMVKRKMRFTLNGKIVREPHPFLSIINSVPVIIG
jgi:cytochrome P450